MNQSTHYTRIVHASRLSVWAAGRPLGAAPWDAKGITLRAQASGERGSPPYNRAPLRRKCLNVSKPLSRRAGDSRPPLDRRSEPDRRGSILRALWYGSVRPRRQGPRRRGEISLGAVDWHHPWWLAVALLIVALSCADAALTLLLLNRGAREVNPLLVTLVHGSAAAFIAVKVGLTGAGIICLTLLSRVRAFGWLPVRLVLYGLLLAYTGLVLYELVLLGVL